VLVDMEEGVINAALKGPLGEVFDPVLKVSSVSGSGNNWAVGYYRYGVSHREELLEAVRHAAEACDCLQSFMVLHSMGGGTGSGLGTSVLGMLRDEYPEVYVNGAHTSLAATRVALCVCVCVCVCVCRTSTHARILIHVRARML
jgi:hypothetical protein